MARLGFNPSELCDRFKKLNTQDLSLDSLEKCRDLLPRDDEVKSLSLYKGDITALRDVEQRLRELSFVKRLPQRLELMIFDVQLAQLAAEIQESLCTLTTAAKQMRSSQQLRAILQVVLRLGNFVNYGTTHGCHQTKGFTMESLLKLLELKSLVVPQVTLVHYVAHRVLKLGTEAAPTLRALREELSLVGLASRVSMDETKQQLAAFREKTKAVGSELKRIAEYEPDALEAMQALQCRANLQLEELEDQFGACECLLLDLQHFFGENAKQRTASALFATMKMFVEAFSQAAEQLRKQPKKFELLLQKSPTAAAKTAKSKPRPNTSSLPSASPPSASPGREEGAAKRDEIGDAGGEVDAERLADSGSQPAVATGLEVQSATGSTPAAGGSSGIHCGGDSSAQDVAAQEVNDTIQWNEFFELFGSVDPADSSLTTEVETEEPVPIVTPRPPQELLLRVMAESIEDVGGGE
eukprot:gnl/TRDRNA2_/TRDRNA2_134387_c2_seq1.p1 gnl/TRDRNA2_/TRDRNA2_134387_c2~~gnl/TRDRNA2_/TRDRNA2_134387_c2_seq1.p1  ORF type:complete len:468 (+),score=114.15 gnl/TRDRNA2_/TRDRNA2_134387_c2_seq1:2-1405(+)